MRPSLRNQFGSNEKKFSQHTGMEAMFRDRRRQLMSNVGNNLGSGNVAFARRTLATGFNLNRRRMNAWMSQAVLL